MPEIPNALRKIIAANDPLAWATAGGVALAVFFVALFIRRMTRRQSERFAATEVVELMELPFEIASKTRLLFLSAAALYIGLATLDVPTKVWTIATHIATGVAFWQVGVWASAAVVAWLRVRRKTSDPSDRAAASSLGIIGFVARAVIWSLVTLLALDNFGVDITALVAGLGVGGIAVALAVQNVLGDLFASLSITLDQPFVIGDLIIVGEFTGHVEHIGVKSTRLRSINGEQIIMANADLLGSRVRNYGRMQERRALFTLGVTYETPHDKLQQIPRLIRECIERQELARFDRCHFANYGAFSLDFETVYYVRNADYAAHMNLQQAIFFDVHGAFETAGIEFAYPTQKLWLTKVAGEA